MLLRPWVNELPGRLTNMQIVLQQSGVGLRFCISVKLPGDANTLGSHTTLEIMRFSLAQAE